MIMNAWRVQENSERTEGKMTVSSVLQSRPSWLLRKRKRARPASPPTIHSHPFPLTGASADLW